jgi:hypothetical protein
MWEGGGGGSVPDPDGKNPDGKNPDGKNLSLFLFLWNLRRRYFTV